MSNGNGKLEEKAQEQKALGAPAETAPVQITPKRKRKPPKLIIGDPAEHDTGQTSVQEQTIELGDVGKRGGREGTTIGARPYATRPMGAGVTAGMGQRSRQRH